MMDAGTGTGGGAGGGTGGGVGGGTGGGVGGGPGGGSGGSGDGCGCAVVGAETSSAPTGLSALWLGLLGAFGLRRRARRKPNDDR
jgi:MYXO-CTERM domain-containing protein